MPSISLFPDPVLLFACDDRGVPFAIVKLPDASCVGADWFPPNVLSTCTSRKVSDSSCVCVCAVRVLVMRGGEHAEATRGDKVLAVVTTVRDRFSSDSFKSGGSVGRCAGGMP